MQVTINIPDQLAAEAAARGIAVDIYVEGFVAEQSRQAHLVHPPKSVQDAVERIRALRRGVTLGGEVKIKDLIREGRKY